MRVVALLNAFAEMLAIGAVGCPGEYGLVMLIHAGVVSSDPYADAMERGIKRFVRKPVPRTLQGVDPFFVIFCEGKLILDLEIKPGFTAVSENAGDNHVIQRIA